MWYLNLNLNLYPERDTDLSVLFMSLIVISCWGH